MGSGAAVQLPMNLGKVTPGSTRTHLRLPCGDYPSRYARFQIQPHQKRLRSFFYQYCYVT
jgi:hypothetical protein